MTESNEQKAQKVKAEFDKLEEERQKLIQNRSAIDRKLHDISVRLLQLQGAWEVLDNSGKQPELQKQEAQETIPNRKKK